APEERRDLVAKPRRDRSDVCAGHLDGDDIALRGEHADKLIDGKLNSTFEVLAGRQDEPVVAGDLRGKRSVIARRPWKAREIVVAVPLSVAGIPDHLVRELIAIGREPTVRPEHAGDLAEEPASIEPMNGAAHRDQIEGAGRKRQRFGG